MDEFNTLTDMNLNFTYWVAGLFALLELIRWFFTIKDLIFKKIGIRTKGMLKREEFNNRLRNVEKSIVEIKDTSKQNVDMFINHEKEVVARFDNIRDEIVTELGRLHEKIDEQRDEMDRTNKANDKTDCAMLRDRIGSGMRYFSKNIGPDGKVHISLSDYENMNALFNEYFKKHGNGAFKKLYDDEFTQFVIDR